MKKLLQSALQRLLGFPRYLFVFSLFKIWTLRWDRREGDFHHFLAQLSPDARVLDIGANIGIMTALLAKRCPQGMVHAIEPIPDNYAALQRIVKYFKFTNVQLHRFALGAEKGELKMVMPEVQNVRMQGLSHAVHETITEYNEGQFYTVPQHRLDDLGAVTEAVSAIKIDVENFEYFVFAGGKEMLKRDRPLVYCELWANENRDKCFHLLRDELGYAIKVLQDGSLTDFDPKIHPQQNFFFV
ncbi:MAG: FkbM family methyltransferase [Bacteroidota bacterium]